MLKSVANWQTEFISQPSLLLGRYSWPSDAPTSLNCLKIIFSEGLQSRHSWMASRDQLSPQLNIFFMNHLARCYFNMISLKAITTHSICFLSCSTNPIKRWWAHKRKQLMKATNDKLQMYPSHVLSCAKIRNILWVKRRERKSARGEPHAREYRWVASINS